MSPILESIGSVKGFGWGSFVSIPIEAFESIQSTIVGSGGVSNVEFTSIPQTYKHLQVRLSVRTNRASFADNVRIQFNNNTTSGDYYNFANIIGTGSGTGEHNAGDTDTHTNVASTVAGGEATALMFGQSTCDILDYTSTNKHKTTRYFSGGDYNGQGQIYFGGGFWFPTTPVAITSVKFFCLGSTIQQYSYIGLYGIKG